ncbi:MAG: cytochrome c [Desulfobacterales bacterium]|nr:cytochrome c [Desulfobacterales bacterium]
MKRLCKILAGVVIVAGGLGIAQAQFAGPDKAIKYRQAVMVLISEHFGRMGEVVKGKSAYDREHLAHDAALVNTLAAMPWEAFMVPGADKGKTKLKPEALREPAQFKKAARQLEVEAAKLLTTAGTGDLDAIKKQFGEVAKSCKECHGQFRSK